MKRSLATPMDMGMCARSVIAEVLVDTGDLRSDLERLHVQSFAWARHCCRDRREDARELLQEVYLRVLDGRARFDARSSLKTWLFGVIRRTAREQAHRRWLHSALLERWQRREPEGGMAPDPEHLLYSSERNERLRAAVDRLPRRQQEVLHLVFYQDLTIEECAQMLEISIGSARTHFERGKRRLREILRSGTP
jgi:RNA polymerase sigma factor (sigma-70 family)